MSSDESLRAAIARYSELDFADVGEPVTAPGVDSRVRRERTLHFLRRRGSPASLCPQWIAWQRRGRSS
jgi:hypothetical protein